MRGCLLVLGLLLLPAGSPAQGWTVGVGAGRADHGAVSADVGTHSAMLDLRHAGPHWLYLSLGAPLDPESLPWGAAGVGARLLSGDGPVALGVELGGHAYGYRDPVAAATGGGLTLEALPLLSIGGGPARLEVHSGLLYHAGSYSGEVSTRAVHESGARLTLGGGAFAVSGEGRYVRAEEGSYPYAGAGAELSHGTAQVWGFAGRWLSDAISTPAWGVGVSLGLGERTSLSAGFRQEAEDPLYWNEPRRSWSVGLSRSLGRRAEPASAPVVPPVVSGAVTLRIPVSESAAEPSLAGDFTGWNPVPMQRSGEFWTLTLPIPSGIHRYAFRDAAGNWFVPESVPNRVDDGMGGTSAVLVVP